jgi:hypothetical protein
MSRVFRQLPPRRSIFTSACCASRLARGPWQRIRVNSQRDVCVAGRVTIQTLASADPAISSLVAGDVEACRLPFR